MEKLLKIKTRIKFSALDLSAEIASIYSTVKDCKISSIYNIDNNTYLFKLAKTNCRTYLTIKSGVKLHLVENFVEKNEKPNGFTNKLRKHLKNLLIKNIEQIGAERVCKITIAGVDIENKKFTFYLFVELYAKGNIVFTDSDLRILTLLRPHVYNETAKCLPNEIYPVDEAAKIFADKIILTNKELTPDQITPKSTNYSIVTKLVPCVHQSLAEILLLKNNLRPNDKFDFVNTQTILSVCEEILGFYKTQELKTGYLYFEKGNKYSFELSPVKLDFVSLKDSFVWRHS